LHHAEEKSKAHVMSTIWQTGRDQSTLLTSYSWKLTHLYVFLELS